MSITVGWFFRRAWFIVPTTLEVHLGQIAIDVNTSERVQQYMKSAERHKIPRSAITDSAVEPISSGDLFEISGIGK